MALRNWYIYFSYYRNTYLFTLNTMSAHSIDLRPGERIVAEVRRHMFVFYTQVFTIFLLALLPLIFAVPIANGISNIFPEQGGMTTAVLYLLFLLVLSTIFFMRWTDYYLDVWIVTSERVFDIEQRGLFNRDISVFQLDKIQDITVEIKGVIATFLKFGDIRIHTAGERNDLIIKQAGNPLEIKKAIMNEYARHIQTMNVNRETQISQTDGV